MVEDAGARADGGDAEAPAEAPRRLARGGVRGRVGMLRVFCYFLVSTDGAGAAASGGAAPTRLLALARAATSAPR